MLDAIVVGAGIGGLATAIDLAGRGAEVQVIERSPASGGKIHQTSIEGRAIDVGPTVLTMRWVFDELFEATGARLAEYVTLERADVLARHAFPGRLEGTLDLFADPARSADEIGEKLGARAARGFVAFCEHVRRIYEVVEPNFLRAQRLTPATAVALAARQGIALFSRIDAHRTLHRALGDFFDDPRLLQLFGRYATYCGSSPFEAPATLNVIAHVEQSGVWLVSGGMKALALALERRARELGVAFRHGVGVDEIVVERGRASGVRLASDEVLRAAAVVFNGDAAALADGSLGRAARRAVPAPEARSYSAMTFALLGRTSGLELERHNVVFSRDYAAEFRELAVGVPAEPTVYVCAQDRGAGGAHTEDRERLFVLVNAPPDGDRKTYTQAEIEACKDRTFTTLSRAGLCVAEPSQVIATTPTDFARRFPSTGGALYGPASHGMMSAFARSGATSKVEGLFLAGGSAHPGAGVPMAASSGRLAASRVAEHLASIARSRRTAMPGGISTS